MLPTGSRAGFTGTGLFLVWSSVWLCLVPRVLECKVSDTAPARNIPFRKFDFLKFQGYNEVSMSSVALCAAALHPTMENTW